MNIKRKRKHLIKLFFISILITVLIVIYKVNSSENDVNTDKDVSKNYLMQELEPGQVAFGVTHNGVVINSGETINEMSIKHTIGISQVLSKSREYLILVLVDFNIIKFKVEGEELGYHILNVEAHGENSVSIEFDIDENAKELCYLIVKKPDYFVSDEDIDKSNILQEVYSLRFNLSDEDKIIEYDSCEVTSDGIITDIFMTKDVNDLTVIFEEIEEEKLHLIVGNQSNNEADYALIGLLNWEQVPFEDDRKVKYINIKGNSKSQIDITLPSVNENSLIQYIAFPEAYNVSKENRRSHFVNGTIRCTVLPKNIE